jgi:hypothetical protein
MQPQTAMARLAHYAGEVAGVRASYPATATVVTPHLIVWWDETVQTYASGVQYWLLTARADLLMSLKGNPESEIVTADALIAPIADAFDPNNANHAAYSLTTADGLDRVDFCEFRRHVGGQPVEYAGHVYYGAQMYFEIKLRRFAGSD